MPRPRKPKSTRDTWGSITATHDGRWRLRYPGPDGRRRSGGIFPSKVLADEARARLHAAVAGGSWRPLAPGDSPKLSPYAESWLRRMEREQLLSPRTIALYRHHLDRLVLPDLGGIALGQVPVGRIRREVVAEWEVVARRAAGANASAHFTAGNGASHRRRIGHPARAWARVQGLNVPQTGRLPAKLLKAWREAGEPEVAGLDGVPVPTGERQFEQARTALSAVCTAAVEEGYLAEHPVRIRPGTRARSRSKPAGRGTARTTVGIVSVEAVFALADAMPDPYRIAALLTTFAGLRGGETFALARRHLRYDDSGAVSHVRVERALLELPGQSLTFGPPKTGAGLREIAVPSLIGELVAAHVTSNVPNDPDGILFPTQTGRLVSRSRRSAIIVAARNQVGIREVTWHTLRHTGLTLAASVPGVTVRNLMDRGGHSTPRAALIYQHTAADADAHLAAGLGRLIAGQP